MPAESIYQKRLMQAALHGAKFAKAREIRKSMTSEQIKHYAETPSKGLPKRKAAK